MSLATPHGPPAAPTRADRRVEGATRDGTGGDGGGGDREANRESEEGVVLLGLGGGDVQYDRGEGERVQQLRQHSEAAIDVRVDRWVSGCTHHVDAVHTFVVKLFQNAACGNKGMTRSVGRGNTMRVRRVEPCGAYAAG